MCCNIKLFKNWKKNYDRLNLTKETKSKTKYHKVCLIRRKKLGENSTKMLKKILEAASHKTEAVQPLTFHIYIYIYIYIYIKYPSKVD